MSNSKIVDFKEFVRANPFLISYVKNGSKSWQDLYEMFDMYGDDQESWNKYLDDSNDRSSKNSNSGSGSSFKLDDLVKMAKNVDIDTSTLYEWLLKHIVNNEKELDEYNK